MDYANMAAVATRMLAENGWPIILRNIVPGVGNPNGTVTGGGPVDVTRNGFVFDFNRGQTVAPGGELIQGGDKECLLEAGVTPALEDLIVDEDGTVYVIKGIAKVGRTSIPAAFDLHLRT
jgi:hypothetical protein